MLSDIARRSSWIISLLLSVSGPGRAAELPPITVRLLTSDIQLRADGTSTQITHYEVRANNDAGTMRLGQTAIPYDPTIQDITIVEAHTLKPDGRAISVASEAIYDQMAGMPAGTITSLRLKTVVFPQFATGDTAVYTTRTEVKTPYLSHEFWYADIFPSSYAFDEVRETITAPASFPLRVESHDVEFSQKADGSNIIYAWHYSRPNPTTRELKAVSPLDSEPRFYASTFKDYAELGRSFGLLINPKMVPTATITDLANKITEGIGGRREQARALYDWVATHVRYVAIELGRGSFQPHDPDSIVNNGYGDCKDHVVLLGALLKAKGIESASVLLNSSNFYTLAEVPTFTTLNHLITWIPEFDVYADSSTVLAPFGVLPAEEYGKPVVRVTSTGAERAVLPVAPSGLADAAVATATYVDEKGQLRGTTTTTAKGPYAITLRLLGLGIQSVGAEQAANRQLASLGYTGATGSLDVGLPAVPTPSYTISGSFTVPGWADRISDSTTFFMPGGLRLFGRAGDGPLGPLAAVQPTDMESIVCLSAHMSEDLSFRPPAGFRLTKVPEDSDIRSPFLHFAARWTLVDDELRVHRDFSSNIDQAICTPQIRKQNAAAFGAISDSYNTEIAVEPIPGN